MYCLAFEVNNLRCRPDEVSSHHASETITHSLGRHDEQNLEAPVEELAVVHFLSEKNIDCVTGCSAGSCHDTLNMDVLVVTLTSTAFRCGGPPVEFPLTMIVCSFMLKGQGFRLNFRPKTLNSLLGMIAVQPRAILLRVWKVSQGQMVQYFIFGVFRVSTYGYAISCTTLDEILVGDFLRPRMTLTAATTFLKVSKRALRGGIHKILPVQSTMPITQARTVLTGSSGSSLGET